MEVDSALRLLVFATVFLLLLALEFLIPARQAVSGKWLRWKTNGLLFFAGVLAVRLILPLAAVNAASFAELHQLGLLNAINAAFWFEFLVAVLLLDLAIYGQHVLTHRVPFLWRLHSIHHADSDVDLSTALRFHPVEIALSMVYKSSIVILLGVSWWAVVCFEILLNASAMFNHSKIKLSSVLDSALKKLIVTPSMHVIHHNRDPYCQHQNYGFFLSIWDRVFSTYKAEADGEVIGLEGVDAEQAHSFKQMLMLSPR